MQLSESLLDFADAEYFAHPTPLLQVGCGLELSDQQVGELQQKYPRAADWFASLDNEGKSRVIEYLHRRHSCFARFSC